MTQPSSDQHISWIDTRWTVVLQAHRSGSDAIEAKEDLLQRYGGAVRRYLLGATRQEDAAEELFQEFALLFLRGALRGADPGRGRFRDYVKGVLFHLSADYYKKGKRRPLSLEPVGVEPAVQPSQEQEQAFLTSWRDELLARAWVALQEMEQTTGQRFFTVLRYRADHPEASAQAMADHLSRVLDRELTAAGVRQTLHRAREKFADFLLDEIAHAIADPTPDALEEELIEVGLLEHCRPALQRRGIHPQQ
jgi:RNA polymerase sigma-70 factor (ECF subfamily)